MLAGKHFSECANCAAVNRYSTMLKENASDKFILEFYNNTNPMTSGENKITSLHVVKAK